MRPNHATAQLLCKRKQNKRQEGGINSIKLSNDQLEVRSIRSIDGVKIKIIKKFTTLKFKILLIRFN